MSHSLSLEIKFAFYFFFIQNSKLYLFSRITTKSEVKWYEYLLGIVSSIITIILALIFLAYVLLIFVIKYLIGFILAAISLGLLFIYSDIDKTIITTVISVLAVLATIVVAYFNNQSIQKRTFSTKQHEIYLDFISFLIKQFQNIVYDKPLESYAKSNEFLGYASNSALKMFSVIINDNAKYSCEKRKIILKRKVAYLIDFLRYEMLDRSKNSIIVNFDETTLYNICEQAPQDKSKKSKKNKKR